MRFESVSCEWSQGYDFFFVFMAIIAFFFQLFQAEMFSRQQILHSIISDGQRMLEQGQVDDR